MTCNDSCSTTALLLSYIATVAYQGRGLWGLDWICGAPISVQSNLQGPQMRQCWQSSVRSSEHFQEDFPHWFKVDNAQLPAEANRYVTAYNWSVRQAPWNTATCGSMSAERQKSMTEVLSLAEDSLKHRPAGYLWHKLQ